MGGNSRTGPTGLRRWAIALGPLVLLALVVGLFLATTPLAGLQAAGEPLPELSVDYTSVPSEGTLRLHVTNTGPEPFTVAQVHVDEANWAFEVNGAGGDRTIAPGGSATIDVPYHWTPGYDYDVAVLNPDGASFHATFVATHETPGFTPEVAWTLGLLGVLVGVVPVALGMLWFPYMETMTDRGLHAVLAFSAGILAFLAVDAGVEAIELAGEVPSTYAGPLLVVLGAAGALLLTQAAVDWRGGGEPSPLGLAYAAALGVGLHNLAEGLAIGSAFALGRVSLGAFLVVGFMVHNVTEGPVVVAPLARGRRPALAHFVALGGLAGAPVVLGGWIGNLFYSPLVGALFLAVGVGALLQVVLEVGGIVHRAGEVTAASNLLAFLAGLAVMYATDLLVVL